MVRSHRMKVEENAIIVFDACRYLLLPAREGNVFTLVCQSFCSQEGVGLPNRDPPLDRDPLYSNKRVVRILLECILV